MAGLPPDGEWLIQQQDGQVVVFHRWTEEEIVRFNPSDIGDTSMALAVIFDSEKLTGEQKSFASFWSGYFYANAVL